MIIYVAGKMKGLPNKGRELFDEAETRLTVMGHVVLNPSKLPDGLHVNSYMSICTRLIDAADAIYLLKNWVNSEGAKLEKQYAEYQNKLIIMEVEK